MLDEVPEVPEREHLARDLERVASLTRMLMRALDWLADLALERNRPPLGHRTAGNGRFADLLGRRAGRVSTECRGFLVTLERSGYCRHSNGSVMIDAGARCGRTGHGALKWVVLMVLVEPTREEQAFERLERSGIRCSSQHAALTCASLRR